MASENEKKSRIAATNKPSLTDDVTLMLRSITEKCAVSNSR